MSKTKKRAFTLELTDKETAAFIEQCYRDGTTPAEVLEAFICDLTGAERTRGSDERTLAEQYYKRCGYGFFPNEYRTFTQWLLSDYGIETVAEALDDIKEFEEEIVYLKEHPKEIEGNAVEFFEKEISNSKEEIEFIFREYKKSTSKPESLKEGLKGVREYMEMIKRIKEGGAI